MPERRRVLYGPGKPVQSTPRRFDVGLIQKLEEGLCVTSRNGCLNHCADPLILLGDKREASVREARKRARKVSIEGGELSIQTDRTVADQSGLDDASTHDLVAAIENGRLARAEGALWDLEMDAQRLVVYPLECRQGRGRGIAHLHIDLGLFVEQSVIEHVEVRHVATPAKEVSFSAEHHGIRGGENLLDVQSPSRSNPEAAPLTWSIEGDPIVFAQVAPFPIDKRAGSPCFWHLGLDECPIVSMAHETDFLTFL